jgi:acyl-CoA reductase-like NAD-dependent aldehyde dehydrogenase
MAESIATNSGRGCINASGVWASRHTEEIAKALAAKLGPIDVKPPDDPEAKLAAFTVPGQGKSVWGVIEQDLKESGVKDMTGQYGERLVERELCSYLRPVIAHSSSPDTGIVKKEYMFPFASVVKCPEDQLLKKMGYTLVCTAITKNEKLIAQLSDATYIDRLNIGPIPTTRLNWLQPHEGSIIDFLYRSRAYQVAGV